MQLSGLIPAALRDRGLARARDLAHKGGADSDALDLTAPASLRPFVVAAVAGPAETGGAGRPVLAVTATSREADDLAEALGALIPPGQVAVFPSWETLPHERLSPRSDTVGRRLAVLRRLAHPGASGDEPVQVVVAPVRSLLQPQLKGLGDLEPVELTPGGDAELEGVARRLTDMAYARVDLVTKRGEFAVRGGILDIFPPTDEHPSRVEFWGDEVEEIRTFAVADQRTIDAVERLWAPPCRELLLTPAVRARAAELAEQHPEIGEILDKLAEGIPVEGMESLAPALMQGTDSMELLIDCMPRGTHVLLCDPERIRTRAHDLTRTSDEFLEASWAAAAVGGEAPIDVGAAAFRTLGDVRAHAAVLHQSWWTVSPFGLAEAEAAESETPWLETPAVDVAPDSGDAIALPAQPVPLYHGDTARLTADLRRWAADQWAIALVFEGHGTAQRATELLRDAGLGVTPVDSITDRIEPGQLLVTCGGLNHGFVDEGSRLAVITGNDITGGRGASTKDMRRMPS
nr:hypothetical protein GCM10020092_097900 [Actinoplanes digitatis]